jgi:glycosyltransferase involved in cell wall biosynthesis
MKDIKNKPLISIIMPVFNGAKFLKDAIDSILNQTYTNFEFIIVDDKSTDSSLKIIKSFSDNRIKILQNKINSGVAFSLNKALKVAKGKYIARMDADDISYLNRIEKQVKFLDKNPNIIAVGCQVKIIDNDNQITGTRHYPINPQKCHDYLMLTSPIQHPTLMARAEIYKIIGYTNEYKTAEDWDLYFRFLNYGQLSNINQYLYSYRQLFGTNGFKNIKKAFILITKIRLNAIINYKYKPAWLMLLSGLIQTIVVFALPEKIVFNLFNLWRVQKYSLNPKESLLKLAPN